MWLFRTFYGLLILLRGNILDGSGRGKGIIMKIDRAEERIADYLKGSGFGAI